MSEKCPTCKGQEALGYHEETGEYELCPACSGTSETAPALSPDAAQLREAILSGDTTAIGHIIGAGMLRELLAHERAAAKREERERLHSLECESCGVACLMHPFHIDPDGGTFCHECWEISGGDEGSDTDGAPER